MATPVASRSRSGLRHAPWQTTPLRQRPGSGARTLVEQAAVRGYRRCTYLFLSNIDGLRKLAGL